MIRKQKRPDESQKENIQIESLVQDIRYRFIEL